MTAAAFFDLDRTLLPGASGPAFSRALRQVGVLPDRAIPGEGAVYKLFDLIGETLPSMFLARQAARAAKGWRVQQVREAGELAAEELDGAVPGFARLAVAQHRDEGRKVVVATTSPIDLVRPLAEVLGADELIATTYGVRDGCYDGTIDGRFVWGPGKLGAVRDWAAVNGVAVEESWAYSDSFYDFPLLNAVGTPIVVNPDPRLRLLAAARRWPVVHFDVPQRVPKVVGIEPQMVAQVIGRSPLFPWVHWDIDGTDNIPLTGPAILVANHRSYFDPLAVGRTVSEVHRPVRFLSKKEVLEAPVVGQLVASFGTIPVDRGSGSDEPLLAAAKALEAGEVVALMPQGTIPRGRALYDPELKGRWGAARLAALSKAPVDSDRALGDRSRLAPQPPLPRRPRRRAPAGRAGAGRSTGRAQVPQRRCGHQADHDRHPCAPAARGRGGQGADRRGDRSGDAGGPLGRCRRRDRPPSRHRLSAAGTDADRPGVRDPGPIVRSCGAPSGARPQFPDGIFRSLGSMSHFSSISWPISVSPLRSLVSVMSPIFPMM